MALFKTKVHKHRCDDCKCVIQCSKSLLHESKCDDCWDKTKDELLWGKS